MDDIIEFELPDVGEGVAEGEIVAWHVESGDHVSENQTVVEVETDKAVVDIPSPVDGTVRSKRAAEGEQVPVGETIITFERDGSETAADDGDSEIGTRNEGADDTVVSSVEGVPTDREVCSQNGRVFARPSVRRLARERGVDLAAVAETSGLQVTRRDVLAAASDGVATAEHTSADAVEETEYDGDADRSASSGNTAVEAAPADRDRTLAMPATRRRARELGVSLDDVPTDETRDGHAFVGPEALESFVAAQKHEHVERDQHAQSVSDRPERRIPYTGIRRTIGERMEQSMYTAPQVSHHDTVDASELVEFRKRLEPEAADQGVDLTYLPFVMKACVAALEAYPVLNAELDEDNGEIIQKRYYNLGVATDTDAGLMVPVVEDVDRKNLLEIANDVQDVVQRARDRSIGRTEMEDGTFTVTNIGVIGGQFGTPILNYPEVGILALGALAERPRVVDGEVVPRPVLPISLTSDHRVVDGSDAARFTNEIKRYLENPSLLLLE